jgi:hypothetical protein
VLVRQLDAAALAWALRGERLPLPESYFRVRPGHSDAVTDGGRSSCDARRATVSRVEPFGRETPLGVLDRCELDPREGFVGIVDAALPRAGRPG